MVCLQNSLTLLRLEFREVQAQLHLVCRLDKEPYLFRHAPIRIKSDRDLEGADTSWHTKLLTENGLALHYLKKIRVLVASFLKLAQISLLWKFFDTMN